MSLSLQHPPWCTTKPTTMTHQKEELSEQQSVWCKKGTKSKGKKKYKKLKRLMLELWKYIGCRRKMTNARRKPLILNPGISHKKFKDMGLYTYTTIRLLLPASFFRITFTFWLFQKPKSAIILEYNFTFQMCHSGSQKRGVESKLEVQETIVELYIRFREKVFAYFCFYFSCSFYLWN